MRALLVLMFGICSTLGAEWYASTNGTVAGDGSISSPWSLRSALTNSLIVAGDTLQLRGGAYAGPLFYSTLSGTPENPITVKSCPGEWAVITDGQTFTLGTELPESTDNTRVDGVVLVGSDELPEMDFLAVVGTEMFHGFNKESQANTWGIFRGTNATSHSVGAEVRLVGDFLIHGGSNVIFQSFEIKSSQTNRLVGEIVANSIGCGLNLISTGKGNRALGLVIHNVGHPGIGYWQQSTGSEINGCIIFGNGIYDNDGTWIRGSGIYSQNASGTAAIRNCISFGNLTAGAKVYGETGPVRDFGFENNIVFNNGLASLESTSGSTSTSNTWMTGNVIMGDPSLSYVSTYNRDQLFAGNVLVNGTFGVNETTNSWYTNNIVLGPKSKGVGAAAWKYDSDLLNKADLGVVWDYNTYYLGDASSEYNWVFDAADITAANNAGGGNLKYQNDSGKAWKDWSGFDAHSTYSVGWPTDLMIVKSTQLDWDTNRWHIAVVNTSTATNAAIDLSTNGFAVGESYVLKDAQNWNTTIASGVYEGGTISLPLTLTNLATISGFTNTVPKHSNVDNPGLFNAFVLTRSGQRRHTHTIGSATLGAGSIQ